MPKPAQNEYMKTYERTLQQIGALFQSPEFAYRVANLGKERDARIQPGDWKRVAASLPRLYAVAEAAVTAVALGLAPNIEEALAEIAAGVPGPVSVLAEKCARLAWQAQQPLLGLERLERPIMGYTSANLPPGELEKDQDRVQATAQYLLEELAKED